MRKKIGIISLIVGLLLKLKVFVALIIVFTPIEEIIMAKVFNIPLSTILIIVGIVLILMNGRKK